MFDLSWGHILIVMVVALVVIGPKDLPKFMRTAGQWAGRARAMADQFRKSFDEMARQAELDELRAEVEKLKMDRPLSELENEATAYMTGSPLDPPSAPYVNVENPPEPVNLDPVPDHYEDEPEPVEPPSPTDKAP